MIKDLNTRELLVSLLIKELEYLKIPIRELKRYKNEKVNCYDILDDNNYFLYNHYEILNKDKKVIAIITNK